MNLSLDNLLVLAVVAVAVAYLVRRAYRSMAGRRTGGCGSCASCPAEQPAALQVISSESLLTGIKAPARK